MIEDNLYKYINQVDWLDKNFNGNKAYVCSKFSEIIYKYKPKNLNDRTYFYEINPQVLEEHPNIREFYNLLFNSDFLLLFIVETPSSVTIGVSFYRAIIVASRGTSYWKDWGINLKFLKTKVCLRLKLKFHFGFNTIAINTIEEMYSILESKGIPIYFTGHSLGGAISGIFYYYFKNNCNCHINYRLSNDNANSAYTFAMPKFRNKKLLDVFNGLFHIYNPFDLVPRTPPGILGYCNSDNEYELTSSGLQLKIIRKKMTFLQIIKTILKGKIIKEHIIENYISMLYKTVKK